MTNSKNTPTEALERAYPLRVLRYRLRRASGGAGAAHGGEGIERDLQMLGDCTASLITERRESSPWGIGGGEPGAVGENWLLPDGDEPRADACPTSAPSGTLRWPTSSTVARRFDSLSEWMSASQRTGQGAVVLDALPAPFLGDITSHLLAHVWH